MYRCLLITLLLVLGCASNMDSSSDLVQQVCKDKGYASVTPYSHTGSFPSGPHLNQYLEGFHAEAPEQEGEFFIHHTILMESEWVEHCVRHVLGGEEVPSHRSSILIHLDNGVYSVVGERRHEVVVEKLWDFDSSKDPECLNVYTHRGGGTGMSLKGPETENDEDRPYYGLGGGYLVTSQGNVTPVDLSAMGDDSGIRVGNRYLDVKGDFASMEMVLWECIPSSSHYPGAKGTVYRVTMDDTDKMLDRFPLQYASEEEIKTAFRDSEIFAAWIGTVSYVMNPTRGNMIQMEESEIFAPLYMEWPQKKGGYQSDHPRSSGGWNETPQQLREGDRVIALGVLNDDWEDWNIILIAHPDQTELVKRLAREEEDPHRFYLKSLEEVGTAAIIQAYEAESARVYRSDDDSRSNRLMDRYDGYEENRINIWLDTDGLIFHISRG